MLEKHNQMLVELLSKLHPSGALASDDLRSLTKVRGASLLMCTLFIVICQLFSFTHYFCDHNTPWQLQENIKRKISD
jgi:hypothetical protein